MKKLFSAFVALAFSLSLATMALAGTKADPPKHAGQAQGTAHAKAAGKADKNHQITGTVVDIDASAGTLTVQGRKGTVSLKAAGKASLAGINAGDKVLVKYANDTASSVKKVPANK